MSRHYEMVTRYLNDIEDFINTQGDEGMLRYYSSSARKPLVMIWKDFLYAAMYEDNVRKALEKVLQNPCTDEVKNFNHACRVYIVETWLDDVVEFDWETR